MRSFQGGFSILSNQSLSTVILPLLIFPPALLFSPSFISLFFILLWHHCCFTSSKYQNYHRAKCSELRNSSLTLMLPSPTAFNRTSCGLECYTTCAKACRLVYKQAPKNNTTIKKISQGGARNPENHPGNAARVGIRGVLWPEEELQ